jgi:hypothetical protein
LVLGRIESRIHVPLNTGDKGEILGELEAVEEFCGVSVAKCASGRVTSVDSNTEQVDLVESA